MTHTPGPWAVGLRTIPQYCDNCNTTVDVPYITHEPSGAQIALLQHGWPKAEELGNGRLIAAAPELAEHLRTALEWFDNLEERFGTAGIVDSMPNDRKGRDAWRAALERAGLAPS